MRGMPYPSGVLRVKGILLSGSPVFALCFPVCCRAALRKRGLFFAGRGGGDGAGKRKRI